MTSSLACSRTPSNTEQIIIEPVVVITQPIAESLIARLRAAGLVVHRGSLGDELIPRDRVVALLVGLERVDRESLARFPRLGLVALSSAGTDSIDLGAAQELGIAVSAVPDQATEEVATHALALMLGLIRNLPMQDANIRAGLWQSAHAIITPPRVSLLTLGILGVGRIGAELARMARPLFAEIIAFDPHAPVGERPDGVTMKDSLEDVTAGCDVLSLHVPRTTETERMLSGVSFARSRVRYLVNVSRGGLISHATLQQALADDALAGVGLDVFDVEPPAKDDELLRHPRVISTPHRAYESVQSRRAYAETPVENAIAFHRGEPLLTPVQ